MENIASVSQNHNKVVTDRDFMPQHKLDVRDRGRTSLYPWRGQFSPELVDLLLETHARPGMTVLDPFVGSGTTLFESSRHHLDCYDLEVNPAAVQLSKMARFSNLRNLTRNTIYSEARSHLDLTLERSSKGELFRDLVPSMLSQAQPNEFVYDFLVTTIMLAMGNSDQLHPADVEKAIGHNWAAIMSIPYSESVCQVNMADARQASLPDHSIDLLITSPPYLDFGHS